MGSFLVRGGAIGMGQMLLWGDGRAKSRGFACDVFSLEDAKSHLKQLLFIFFSLWHTLTGRRKKGPDYNILLLHGGFRDFLYISH